MNAPICTYGELHVIWVGTASTWPTVPKDGLPGFAPRCLCRDFAGDCLYRNDGTAESCRFVLVEDWVRI